MEEQQNPQQYPNQTPPPQNNYGNPQQQYQQPQNGYGYPQQQYQQPQNGYGYPQQQYQQPQNNYGYPQQQYQQPQNNYAYPQQQYQQPQNNYGYSQQQYQQPYQPYAPQMQNGCAYQPPQKKEPGRVANFFLSLLPLVGFFAVQILVSVVVVVIMVFVNAFQSGRTQNVMARRMRKSSPPASPLPRRWRIWCRQWGLRSGIVLAFRNHGQPHGRPCRN